jgi:hypothetical protein
MRALLDAIPIANPRDKRQRHFLTHAEIEAGTPVVTLTQLTHPATASQQPQLVEVAPGHHVEAIVKG